MKTIATNLIRLSHFLPLISICVLSGTAKGEQPQLPQALRELQVDDSAILNEQESHRVRGQVVDSKAILAAGAAIEQRASSLDSGYLLTSAANLELRGAFESEALPAISVSIFGTAFENLSVGTSIFNLTDLKGIVTTQRDMSGFTLFNAF